MFWCPRERRRRGFNQSVFGGVSVVDRPPPPPPLALLSTAPPPIAVGQRGALSGTHKRARTHTHTYIHAQSGEKEKRAAKSAVGAVSPLLEERSIVAKLSASRSQALEDGKEEEC